MISFYFKSAEQDSFIITPALVVTQGRCLATDELVWSFRVSLSWLLWDAGVEIDFD